MEREEYLKKLLLQINLIFGIDLSKDTKIIKFSFECFRRSMKLEEAIKKLEDKCFLIRLK